MLREIECRGAAEERKRAWEAAELAVEEKAGDEEGEEGRLLWSWVEGGRVSEPCTGVPRRPNKRHRGHTSRDDDVFWGEGLPGREDEASSSDRMAEGAGGAWRTHGHEALPVPPIDQRRLQHLQQMQQQVGGLSPRGGLRPASGNRSLLSRHLGAQPINTGCG